MTDKTIKLKLSAEQATWLEIAAADEGMDSATFARVLIDRLSKGRAPLISQMTTNAVAQDYVPQYPHVEVPREIVPEFAAGEIAPAFTGLGGASEAEVRMALAADPIREPEYNYEANGAPAVSLRSIPREVYNPLPK